MQCCEDKGVGRWSGHVVKKAPLRRLTSEPAMRRPERLEQSWYQRGSGREEEALGEWWVLS